MVDIGGTEREEYPSDFKFLKPTDNVLLIESDAKRQFYVVGRRDKIPLFQKQDTSNWLLSAGATYNAGDISDYLEPESNVLYVLAFGIASDRNVEVEINNPASTRLFGTKKESPIKVTPETSPYDEPTITLISWGTSFVPAFNITNPTEYTVGYLKFFFKGYKYELTPISETPNVYDVIDLRRVVA